MTNWKYRINVWDIFHNESMSFEERRDAIVKRIMDSSAYKRAVRLVEKMDPGGETDQGYEHEEFIENVSSLLEDTQNTDDFDYYWDLIYDYADSQSIWIETVI